MIIKPKTSMGSSPSLSEITSKYSSQVTKLQDCAPGYLHGIIWCSTFALTFWYQMNSIFRAQRMPCSHALNFLTHWFFGLEIFALDCAIPTLFSHLRQPSLPWRRLLWPLVQVVTFELSPSLFAHLLSWQEYCIVETYVTGKWIDIYNHGHTSKWLRLIQMWSVLMGLDNQNWGWSWARFRA